MHTIHTLYTDADISTDLDTSAMALEPRTRLYAVQTPSGDDQATQAPGDEPGTVTLTLTHTLAPRPSHRPNRRAPHRRAMILSWAKRAAVAVVVFAALRLLWHYLTVNDLWSASLLTMAIVLALVGLSWAGWS